MTTARSIWLLAGGALLLAACGDSEDEAGVVQSELSGANEVPPAATEASGQAEAELVDNQLVVTGEFSGLESDLMEVEGTPAHVHVGDVDEAGPILFGLDVDSDDGRSGTLTGRAELTDEQVQQFERGLLYVNVHTERYPAGELRAQLMDGAPEVEEVDGAFETMLLADNEVGDVDSDAEGRAMAVLRGDQLTVSGRFSDLTSPLEEVEGSSAHIHEAPPGENGPVVFPLEVAPDEDMRSGRFTLLQMLSEEEVATLREGNYYINVHSQQFPAGEIRGQLVERGTR